MSRIIKPEEISDNVFKLIGKDWLLVAAKNGEDYNAMTASWGGLGVLWNKNVAYVFIRPQRYTKEFVDAGDTFSLSVFDESHRDTLMYLGRISGRDEAKMKHSKLTADNSGAAPIFSEARLTFICKKLYASPLLEQDFIDKKVAESCYPEKDFHIMYVAEIIKVLED